MDNGLGRTNIMETKTIHEEWILEQLKVYKDKKMHINKIIVKYGVDSKDVPFLILNAKGIPGVITDEDYFENVEDNLIAANFSLITPLINELSNFKINLEIECDEEGTLDLKNVKVELKKVIKPPKRDLAIHTMFSQLSPLHTFVTDIQFGGINTINIFDFVLNVNSMKLIPLFSNGVNTTIVGHWFTCYKTIAKRNEGQYNISYKVSGVNGIMNPQLPEEDVIVRLNFKRISNYGEEK